MSVQTIAPIPTSSAITQLDDRGKPVSGYPIGGDYYLWLFALSTLVQSSAKLIGNAVTLAGQVAAIGSTPIPLPALTAGLYRVSFYARVTAAAATSSTLGPFTLGWTDGGNACSVVASGVTGNTTTTVLQGSTPINIDPASAITYTMGYASNLAATMTYSLIVAVEQVA